MDIKGRDLSGRLPKIVRISSNEVTEALQDELRDVINAIKKVLQDTPPELEAWIVVLLQVFIFCFFSAHKSSQICV